MNQVLLEAFRHSSWATKALIAPLRRVSAEVLTNPHRGYAGLLRTLNNLILSDAYTVHMLIESRPPWTWPKDATNDLDELEARLDHVADLWEEVLGAAIDADRILVLNENAYELTVATILTQALHHGHSLREQVKRGLGNLRVERPNIQPYVFAMETGRGRALPGAFPSAST